MGTYGIYNEEFQYLCIESLTGPTTQVLKQAVEDFQIDVFIGKGKSARKILLELKIFSLIGTTSRPSQVNKQLRRWMIPFNFGSYDEEQISKIIELIAIEQNVTVEPTAAHLLAMYSDGSVGNAKVLFKRVMRYGGGGSALRYKEARQALISFHFIDERSGLIDLESKLKKMNPVEFEAFVGNEFHKLGYAVEMTKGSGDHGIDLLIRKGNELAVVQCKQWTAPVGEPVVRDFFGSLVNLRAQHGYLVTTSSFTTHAFSFVQDKPIRLMDLDALIELVNQGSNNKT